MLLYKSLRFYDAWFLKSGCLDSQFIDSSTNHERSNVQHGFAQTVLLNSLQRLPGALERSLAVTWSCHKLGIVGDICMWTAIKDFRGSMQVATAT